MSAEVRHQTATVVHNAPDPVPIVPDISGALGAPATFDGSGSTVPRYYHWGWVSVPGGSAIANASIPFPDSQATSPIDMTDNEGLWHFEGNADDTSGNGNNGTVNGATLVTGKVGSQAYQFDGSNDYITAPSASSLQIAGDISISAWIKVDSYSQYESIIQYSNSGESEANNHLYNVTWANAGGDIRLFWEYGGGSNVITDFNTNLNTGQWYHIVVVRDASEKQARLYVDGTLFDSKTYSNNPTGGTTSQLWIGTDGGSGGYFDGTIDEVAIWSRAISDSEVADIYAAQEGSLAGIGSSAFAFTPDVEGTYTINLEVYPSFDTNADCVVTAGGGGVLPPIQGQAAQGVTIQGSLKPTVQGQ